MSAGTSLGEARVVLERSLLGEKSCVKGCEDDVLFRLVTLLAAPKSHQPPTDGRNPSPEAVCLKSGICRNKKGLFKIYTQFGKLRVDSQETPSLEEALDFHVTLNNLKKKALVRMHYSQDNSSPRVIMDEILDALREQPRLQLVFWTRKDKYAFSPKFSDFILAELHGKHLLGARKGTATKTALKKARDASTQNLEVRKKRAEQLMRDVTLEMASRVAGLISRNTIVTEELKQHCGLSSVALALRLGPADSLRIARRIESLPRDEFKIRKQSALHTLLRYRVPALRPPPPLRRLALTMPVAETITVALDDEPCLWRQRLAQRPGWFPPVGGIAAGFLSLYDLSTFRAASVATKGTRDLTASHYLREFQFVLGSPIIGITDKVSVSGRVLRRASGRYALDTWLLW